jgi:Fe-S cluster assembly protein SufD
MALHTAFWSGGHLLYVPRGVVIDQPLHAYSVIANNGSDLGRTLVVLEEGAEAAVLSETCSPTEDTSGFHCGVVEIRQGPRSNLRYVNLQNWGMGVWHFARQQAIVRQDASLQWTVGAMGAKFAKVDQQVALIEPGANCQVNGTMFTEGKQQLTYNTLQHHVAPHCKSDFLYKAALQDRSRTVWRGMIKVDPGAIKTDGYQRNDNLLLSPSARADSIPGLEIKADDVRCTHGATSGRVDEELIFYARCRGFSRQEAIQMIVTGFFQQVYDRIPIETVREALGRAIARRVREYE